MIFFILASTSEGIIGNNNKLCWNIKEDLEIFRKLTLNSTILMGYKTFQSLPFRPLNKRISYVLTTKKTCPIVKDLYFINEYSKLINSFKNTSKKLFIIGGESIYRLFNNIPDYIYISIIKKKYQGNIKINITKLLKNYSALYKKEYKEFIFYKYKNNTLSDK